MSLPFLRLVSSMSTSAPLALIVVRVPFFHVNTVDVITRSSEESNLAHPANGAPPSDVEDEPESSRSPGTSVERDAGTPGVDLLPGESGDRGT